MNKKKQTVLRTGMVSQERIPLGTTHYMEVTYRVKRADNDYRVGQVDSALKRRAGATMDLLKRITGREQPGPILSYMRSLRSQRPIQTRKNARGKTVYSYGRA